MTTQTPTQQTPTQSPQPIKDLTQIPNASPQPINTPADQTHTHAQAQTATQDHPQNSNNTPDNTSNNEPDKSAKQPLDNSLPIHLLIIGFSQQNANAIMLLTKMLFENCQCHFIARQFADNLSLTLPSLPKTLQKHTAFIINLDGVGMGNHDALHQAQLSAFMSKIPTLLISRRMIETWQTAYAQTAHILCLPYPFSKQQMSQKLMQLGQLVASTQYDSVMQGFKKPSFSAKDLPMPDYQTQPIPHPHLHHSDPPATLGKNLTNTLNNPTHRSTNQPSNPAKANNTAVKSVHFKNKSSFFNVLDQSQSTDLKNKEDKTQNDTNQSHQTQLIFKALKEAFPNIAKEPWIEQIIHIQTSETPIKVEIGSYQMLILAKEGSLITQTDLGRILDYLRIVSTQTLLDDIVTITPLAHARYHSMLEALEAEGAKKQSLNTALWQMSMVVLKRHQTQTQHHLSLKIKRMPNLAEMQDQPKHLYAMLSACLVRPFEMNELARLFPHLSVDEINRIWIVSVVSGMADIEAMQAKSPQLFKKAQNAGIKKAKKSGFFERLLKKLIH